MSPRRPLAEDIAVRDRLDRRAVIEQLRAHRERLGLAQHDVASRMHVSQRTVSTFERSGDPLFSSLQRYAAAINARIVITIEQPFETREDLTEREWPT